MSQLFTREVLLSLSGEEVTFIDEIFKVEFQAWKELNDRAS